MDANGKLKRAMRMDEMVEIEIQAMTTHKIPEDVARGWVIKALEDIKAETITHLPFTGKKNIIGG